MLAPNRNPLLALLFIIVFLLSWTRFIRGGNKSFLSIPSSFHREADVVELQDPIRNTTLGFQEIFSVILPDRVDRRQPLLDAAKASNLSITLFDAVRDKNVNLDAWPENWLENWNHDRDEGDLGCLVSHTMAWERIVAENISSALILESDADWDLRIIDIMYPLGEAVTRISDWPNRIHDPAQPHSPYGDDWDLIWMGHCGSTPSGRRFYEINDTTVPPSDHYYSYAGVPGDDVHKPGTRILYSLQDGICAYGYAVSNKGAKKMVEYIRDTDYNLDIAMSDFCTVQAEMNCVGVYPQVFTASPSKSNFDRGGEHDAPGQNQEHDMIVSGPGLQYSARVNSETVLKGLGREHWWAEWNSTWAVVNDTWSQVSFDE